MVTEASTPHSSEESSDALSKVNALALITNFARASHLLDGAELHRTISHIIDYLDSVSVEDRIIITLMMIKAKHLPDRLAIHLATDQIEVASVLLEKRTQISESVLLDVLDQTQTDHHRVIASRPSLSATLCTAIIGAGHEAALVALAENRTAKIDEEGFGRMAALAGRFHLLRLPLALRDDTPSAALVQLKSSGSETLGAYIDCLVDNRKKDLPTETISHSHDWSHFTTNLARLANLSYETVDRVVGDGSTRALAMVARSIGMDRLTFDRFIDLVALSRGGTDCVQLPSEQELSTMFYELSPSEARLALERNLVGS